jgi:hypothetical protein
MCMRSLTVNWITPKIYGIYINLFRLR